MKKKMSRLFFLLLSLSAATALADGGDWKMGPFGPYWDENEWPEFTPMYWMEEFMNRLDDDDDDIREWMYQNQAPGQFSPGQFSPGQFPQAGAPPGNYPFYGLNSPSPYGWQPYGWNSPWASPYSPYVTPYGGLPGSGWDTAPVPGAMVPPAAGAYPPMGDELPALTPDQYARMPRSSQREYRRAYDRRMPTRREALSRPRRESLPNLTPEEFARMPPALQRQYKRDFDREYARYRAREAWLREQQRRARSSPEKKRRVYAPSDRYPGRYSGR